MAGNRYNRRTNIILRPPVCHSPPPPRHPDPIPPPTCSISLSAPTVNVQGHVTLTTSYDWAGISPGTTINQVWLTPGGTISGITQPQNGVPNSGTATYNAGIVPGTYNISVVQGPSGDGACPNTGPITINPRTPVTTACCPGQMFDPVFITFACTSAPCLNFTRIPMVYVPTGVWRNTSFSYALGIANVVYNCFGTPPFFNTATIVWQTSGGGAVANGAWNFGSLGCGLPWTKTAPVNIPSAIACSAAGMFSAVVTVE